MPAASALDRNSTEPPVTSGDQARPCGSEERPQRQLSSRVSQQHETDGGYKNNLLSAIGFLDTTNALDFPANVWNQIPTPYFAKVLMGLGGSIAITSTAFAVWDVSRARRNVRFLRRERAYLQEKRKTSGLSLVETAWLDISFRELGWELIDRLLLDVFMVISGLLVGAGTIMAMRGEIHAIYIASNLLSGYIGNSFITAYAVVNAIWSAVMWRRARAHDTAFARAASELDSAILRRARQHSRKHKFYALLTALTMIVSGAGSEISATMWEGYCVLIPCVISSIFCNFYWRLCVNYNRRDIRLRASTTNFDILDRLSTIMAIQASIKTGSAKAIDLYDFLDSPEKDRVAPVTELLQDLGLDSSFFRLSEEEFAKQRSHIMNDEEDSVPTQATPQELADVDSNFVFRVANRVLWETSPRVFRDEERFLLELLGCFLNARHQAVGQTTLAMSNEPSDETGEKITDSPADLSTADQPREREEDIAPSSNPIK